MELIDFWGLLGVPFVIALVEMTKRILPELPDRFLPLWALVFGIAVEVFIALQTGKDLALGIFTGIVVALGSMGLFSGIKKASGL